MIKKLKLWKVQYKNKELWKCHAVINAVRSKFNLRTVTYVIIILFQLIYNYIVYFRNEKKWRKNDKDTIKVLSYYRIFIDILKERQIGQ